MNHIKKILLSIIASWLAVYVTSHYFPTYLSVSWGVKAFALSGIIFWLLNWWLKPILKLFTFPFIILSVWLFTFLINWFIIYLTERFFIWMPSLWVTFAITWGFFAYIVVAVVLGSINYLAHWLIDIHD